MEQRHKFYIAGLSAIVIALIWLMPRQQPRDTVSATLFPVYDIVRNIAEGGPEVKLVLAPEDGYNGNEMRPATMRAVTDSKVLYSVGNGVDRWADEIAFRQGVPLVKLDHGIELLREDERDGHADSDYAPDRLGKKIGPIDPHYWLSAKNAAIMAENVANDLITRFPDKKPLFRSNLAIYKNKLKEADEFIRVTLGGIGNRKIITLTSDFNYFAKDYGLEVVAAFDVYPDTEPSAAYLAKINESVSKHDVTTLYIEQIFNSEIINKFAEAKHLKIVELDDLGGRPGTESLINLLKYDAVKIADGQAGTVATSPFNY